MNGIVHGPIHKITQYKTREKYKSIFFHGQVHDPENSRGNDDAGNWGHEKTFFVTGEMMMIAMHHIDELLGPVTFRNGVKSKAMHQIFEKGPEKATRQKGEENRGITEFQLKMTQIDEIDDHGHIHPPNHQWVGFGEHFHVTIAEKLGLTLIMNLLKLHLKEFVAQK